jgi:FAD synthetase
MSIKKEAKLHKQSTAPTARIMVFGTFDIVHPGHEHFFLQARKLAKNPYLIVSVARDKNVKKIKGFYPKNNEQSRKQTLARHRLVEKAILGGITSYLPHIIKERPDIIALGYDQIAYTQHLKKDLAEVDLHPRIVRLRAHRPHIFKTSLLTKSKK